MRNSSAEPGSFFLRVRPLSRLIVVIALSASAFDVQSAEGLAADDSAKRTRLLVRHRNASAPFTTMVVPSDAVDSSLRKLRARSDVEFAVVDRRRKRHALPSDPLFTDQWYLQSSQPAAIDAVSAWNTTTGSAGTIVAILDSGVRLDHPDLMRASRAGKLLPGYDFVSADGGSGAQFLTANDGNGRDPDPTDPGDWVDGTDRQRAFFSRCDIENSSWHGTRVSGLIAAATDNGTGIAGIGWQTWILPVRVLGKCGGYDFDILDAMRWSAGIHVEGVPDNPYPANIINLSLGADGVCSAAYRQVIDEVIAKGVVIIASAGNDGGPVEEPANCPGVIAVAGLRHAGTKVGYSNLGPEVAIAAPAGNCVNLSGACLFSLTTTYDVGRTVPVGPGFTDQFNTNLGTSFSAPLVAGVSALMHAVNPRMAQQHWVARIKSSARPFPDGGLAPPATCHVPLSPIDIQQEECVCTTSTCGAGMLHAPSAVAAAQKPIVSITAPAVVNPGAMLTLSGASSAASCNRSIASYAWSVESVQGATIPIATTPNQVSTDIAAPVSGSYTLRLTITDDRGATDFGDVVISSTTATTTTIPPVSAAACPAAIAAPPDVPEPPPAPVTTPTAAPSTESGGGGKFDFEFLALLALVAIHRVRPSSSCRRS